CFFFLVSLPLPLSLSLSMLRLFVCVMFSRGWLLFEVNLQTGPSNDQDKALHFKPCIGQKVTLNSFRNGKWESEESASVEPFTSGAPFTMFFVTTPQGYEVYVNGFQHCMFKHRIPLEKINSLIIRGDVSANMIGMIKVSNALSFFINCHICGSF
uniref:Galectin n=1 Tax=Astyanax mexicanus TaxID=7994 RepID=A0A3B1JCG2_ASTMX